jgi:hypothetical protein
MGRVQSRYFATLRPAEHFIIGFMPVTSEENEKYRRFVSDVAKEMGVFDFEGEQIVWHYTNGPGFLGIIQSSTLYATQVASLNDVRETRYATDLYKETMKELLAERKDDAGAVAFLDQVLEYVKEDPASPTHGTSKFFVTCFSADEDELTQWDRYGGDNGYAIGFRARGLYREPNSQLYRVIYDRDKQLRAARKIVDATLNFYMRGFDDDEARAKDPELWGKDFFAAWDEWVYKLAPLAKDPSWRSENEFRIVHELKPSEFSQVRFAQKKTMISRYLALDTPSWVKWRSPRLPLAKVLIGHGNHPAFTAISVRLLLEQMGYAGVPVEMTKCSFTRP